MPPRKLNLSSPDPLNRLGNTNIVRLKLVKSHADQHRRALQQPPEKHSRLRQALAGDVVNDHGLEADVGVDEESGTEEGVGGRVEGAGDEWRDCERDEAHGDQALEGPVVGAVRRICGWDNGGVVCYARSVRLASTARCGRFEEQGCHTSSLDDLCESISDGPSMQEGGLGEEGDVRGPAGRICCLPPAWKAATLALSRTNAPLTECRVRTEGVGLERAVGNEVETLVVKARFETAARPHCLSRVGRTIEAIAKSPLLLYCEYMWLSKQNREIMKFCGRLVSECVTAA